MAEKKVEVFLTKGAFNVVYLIKNSKTIFSRISFLHYSFTKKLTDSNSVNIRVTRVCLITGVRNDKMLSDCSNIT